MSHMRYLLLVCVAALSSSVAGSQPRAQEQPPHVQPTRDVEISYQYTRPDLPAVIERRRWLASEHLMRIDGPDKSATIFDRNKGEFTLIDPKNRTYRKFEGSIRMPMAPGRGVELKRGAEFRVAGLSCTEWTWTIDYETRTACLTPDGVMLRLVVDGETILQARSVTYAPQPAKLFQVPPNYEPALAPEGPTD